MAFQTVYQTQTRLLLAGARPRFDPECREHHTCSCRARESSGSCANS